MRMTGFQKFQINFRLDFDHLRYADKWTRHNNIVKLMSLYGDYTQLYFLIKIVLSTSPLKRLGAAKAFKLGCLMLQSSLLMHYYSLLSSLMLIRLIFRLKKDDVTD